MSAPSASISSPYNPRVKQVVKLRQRSHRDETGVMIVEGYREVARALENRHLPQSLFVCPEFFLGHNEQTLIDKCREAGIEVLQCAPSVFEKMAYRDRPEGLLAIAPQIRRKLEEVRLSSNPLIVVAESIEKPGNLGTILRSADGAGVDCVLVCDGCTDVNNPNVVRASIGTLFSLPVVETSSADALAWLRERRIQVLATTPHEETEYTSADMRKPTAIVAGAEQYGLSGVWLDNANIRVRIPMLGQGDSLNVASAATILLYEAIRQRGPRRGRERTSD